MVIEKLFYEIDHLRIKKGKEGTSTIAPMLEEEISRLLAIANQNKFPVTILGGGTKIHKHDREDTIVITLEDYKGIVEHSSKDTIITVKAGSKFQEVQDFLSSFGQKIPLDPYWPSEATIGGVIASNDNGPKRLAYGSARDSVIGMRVVYPDGRVIRTGGKVVKNVAGYDMNKLFIGAMGTLAVISEVTFKLRPIAEYESLLLVSFSEKDKGAVRNFIRKLIDTSLEPCILELFNKTMAEKLYGQNQLLLAISFEGNKSSVLYQQKACLDLLALKENVTIFENGECKVFWNKVSTSVPNNNIPPSDSQWEIALKFGVVNLDMVKVIDECDLLNDVFPIQVEAHGGLGHGVGHVKLMGELSYLQEVVLHLRHFVEGLGGYMVVRNFPKGEGNGINFWGEKPPYFSLLEGIKTAIDPNRIMNPGIFIGGI